MSDDGFYYRLPAARGIQAGRCFYNISIPMRILIKLLRIDGGDVLERSQRTVNENRAKKVATYINDNPDSFIIPCLTGVVEVPGGVEQPVFEEQGESGVGTLKVSMDCNIKLFDGQHRATGIARALQDNSALTSQTAAVMLFVDMTLAERKMAFTDINQNVSKPAQSLSDAYNSRDPLPQLAIELATVLPCFKGLVDFERNTITAKSEFLFPLKTIKDATSALLGSDFNEADIDLAKRFWSRMSDAMKWGGLHNGDMTTQEIRDSTILTHSVMINAMGFAGKRMITHAFIENIDLSALSNLDYSKSSSDFMKRCIEPETGRMKADKTAIKLCAIRLLKAVNIPIEPELKALEKQFFGTDEAVLEESKPKKSDIETLLLEQFELYPDSQTVFSSIEQREELVEKVLQACKEYELNTNNAEVRRVVVMFLCGIIIKNGGVASRSMRWIRGELRACKSLHPWLGTPTTDTAA